MAVRHAEINNLEKKRLKNQYYLLLKFSRTLHAIRAPHLDSHLGLAQDAFINVTIPPFPNLKGWIKVVSCLLNFRERELREELRHVSA